MAYGNWDVLTHQAVVTSHGNTFLSNVHEVYHGPAPIPTSQVRMAVDDRAWFCQHNACVATQYQCLRYGSVPVVQCRC